MDAPLKPSSKAERIAAALERLSVSIEKRPSGAFLLRKAGCHLMVTALETINDDDLSMFAGSSHRFPRNAGHVGGPA